MTSLWESHVPTGPLARYCQRRRDHSMPFLLSCALQPPPPPAGDDRVVLVARGDIGYWLCCKVRASLRLSGCFTITMCVYTVKMSDQTQEVALRPASPSNLPPELLGRIFEHHIQSCKDVWDLGPPSHRARTPPCSSAIGPYTWIRVTHVCQYWRDVALANSLLWSHIVLTRSVECVQTILARSQQAPLTVQSFTSSCLGECAMPLRPLRLALAQLHRIRVVELYVKWWVFDDIAAALEKPAPLLESFKLSTPSGLYDAGFVLPVVEFNYTSIVPPLKDLTLCSYGFPWRNPRHFRNLRSLHIQKGIPYCPLVEDVLRALRVMPDLTSLRLDDIFDSSPRDLTTLPILSDVVELSMLKDLTLSGDAVSCASLLHSLRFPTDTHLVLGLPKDQNAEHLKLALSVVRTKLGLRDTKELRYDAPMVAVLEQDRSSFIAHLSYKSRTTTTALVLRIPVHSGCLDVLRHELGVGDATKICLHGIGDGALGCTTSELQRCTLEEPFTLSLHVDGLLAECNSHASKGA